ncbi:Hypothetical Protein FCC1311_114502 [Hondaea fermentalgiana]|uniref:Uncharacterized protein n=1 Tax=Hondaea fermentalgiana TaxID=2315210 RepID=A0A2R5GWM0_9STRA|nr:Hypothetical Protein FCC1311_114502 [Hondaea fermentalgiana]|eukprot:GBG35227.1 Hypothetical Protein FCC1311_114502 [Hondaea fermentalgiana]
MSKRADKTPEEGVKRGLRGQRAVEKAIGLIRNGVKTIDLQDRNIGDNGSVALGKELITNDSLVSLK